MDLIGRILAIFIVSLGVLYWIVQFVATILLVKKVRAISALPATARTSWPRVSVIMPARNEADTIEAALHMRCASDYPDLELIVVNDRSIDDTGMIAERMAVQDKRIRVLHVDSLPEGWLGKLHAMHVGAQEASGQWLLFSDADVHVKPGTLRRVIAWCEDKRIDHMAVIPDLSPVGFFVDVTLSVFMRQICIFGQAWRVEDPGSGAAIGAGAFNLVRRGSFDAVRGFEKIRLTVTDDFAFGRVLKESGARAGVLNGRGRVTVCFYRTLHDMAIGSERALFTMFGKFSALRLIAFGMLMLVCEVAPFIALFFDGLPLVQLIGLIFAGVIIATSIIANVYLGRAWWTAFFVPVANVIMCVCTVRAAILGAKRGGIIWRGTFYSNEQLRTFRQL
ncbi:glycosyltransferase [candidate division WOR-3 bacterium]|nr:glycosyltransferase [candidate division WOR-3 bacterium]